mmetsp:Transcript_24096/g.73582  ORF Transcript_24096/g.73582 Transcript_24096/m.73582 type:complete len:299 (+) Transcript_24096:69-965(+)
MPRRRSQTGFTGILPPELVERCLEFLPFEEVHTNAKQVSKAMRSAARRCLTRGRWRPLKYVVENAMVTNALERPSSAAETATFRAAWAVDPRQVLLEFILLWNNKRESCLAGDSTILTDTFWNWDRGNTLAGMVGVFKPSVARFLALVEPSIDGLGRLTMALERVERYLVKKGPGRFETVMPIKFLSLWTERLGESALVTRWLPGYAGNENLMMNLDELLNPESLVGSGLESWAEPSDMASFIFWLREWDSDEIHRLSDIALALSMNWQDRQKSGAFVAAAVFFVARLRSDLDEESAA